MNIKPKMNLKFCVNKGEIPERVEKKIKQWIWAHLNLTQDNYIDMLPEPIDFEYLSQLEWDEIVCNMFIYWEQALLELRKQQNIIENLKVKVSDLNESIVDPYGLSEERKHDN